MGQPRIFKSEDPGMLVALLSPVSSRALGTSELSVPLILDPRILAAFVHAVLANPRIREDKTVREKDGKHVEVARATPTEHVRAEESGQ